MQPQYPGSPQRDPGITFLGMSGGILMLVMSLVIILPVLGCFLCCVFGGGMALITPTPTSTP